MKKKLKEMNVKVDQRGRKGTKGGNNRGEVERRAILEREKRENEEEMNVKAILERGKKGTKGGKRRGRGGRENHFGKGEENE